MPQDDEPTPKLRTATYTKVANLSPGTNGSNFVALVVSVEEVVDKKRYDGSIVKIAEALIGDETGCVILTARNDQIDLLTVGQNIVIRNSTVDMFNGFMRLSVTQWGKLSKYPDNIPSTPAPVTSVNTKNNLSSIEYELVSVDDH